MFASSSSLNERKIMTSLRLNSWIRFRDRLARFFGGWKVGVLIN